MTEITDVLETNYQTTTANLPQANGKVERLNQTLVDMLSIYLSDDYRDLENSASICMICIQL